MADIQPHKQFKGVYQLQKGNYTIILTKNLTPGKQVYDEEFYYATDAAGTKTEYRTWNPQKSKLGAGIVKAISQIGMREGDVVLYLGASTGTTTSHVSDIVGKNGFVFALDFAPRVLRDLVFLAEERPNIAPILADANKPYTYFNLVCEVDTIFMDIAQKNQTEIFIKNCHLYLKQGGFGLLALKARSVDVTRHPKEIFKQVRAALEKELVVVDYRELDPFEKDHALFVVKKR